ncbi:MAG: hypothetical protein ACLFSQ_09275 [Candidatus Zixiibacteriota bacterium]
MTMRISALSVFQAVVYYIFMQPLRLGNLTSLIENRQDICLIF